MIADNYYVGKIMNIKKLLGKQIQEIRKKKKLTQEQVAELVGLETSSISNIENGKYFPTAENLEKIIKILNIKPSEIFNFEYLAPKDELIDEMYNAMKQDEKLARLMYKFYSSVKY